MNLINKNYPVSGALPHMLSAKKHMRTEETRTVRLSIEFFFEVHLAPKYFFRLNKFLHLFETHCAFLN